jgi:hypothetical protein
MQGLRPMFLPRCRPAPKQASASRHRRRNRLRFSGLHHSKENLKNMRYHSCHSERWSTESRSAMQIIPLIHTGGIVGFKGFICFCYSFHCRDYWKIGLDMLPLLSYFSLTRLLCLFCYSVLCEFEDGVCIYSEDGMELFSHSHRYLSLTIHDLAKYGLINS